MAVQPIEVLLANLAESRESYRAMAIGQLGLFGGFCVAMSNRMDAMSEAVWNPKATVATGSPATQQEPGMQEVNK